MAESFKSKSDMFYSAIRRVREGKIERTVLKLEGPRAYSVSVERNSNVSQRAKRTKAQ